MVPRSTYVRDHSFSEGFAWIPSNKSAGTSTSSSSSSSSSSDDEKAVAEPAEAKKRGRKADPAAVEIKELLKKPFRRLSSDQTVLPCQPEHMKALRTVMW